MPAIMQKIDEMDVSEKVQVMDYLWSSLESGTDSYTPPAWHGHELARRERLYAEGKVPVYDWAEVKARLQARRFGRDRRYTPPAFWTPPHGGPAFPVFHLL